MTIKLNAATGGGSVSLSAPNSTTSNLDVELTLPVDDGAANTFLKSDGSGTLSWAAASSDNITEGNTTVECVDTGSDGHITFDTEGSEAARFDSGGRLLINGTTSHTWSGGQCFLQVNGTSASGNVHLGAFQYSNSADGGELVLGSSRGTTVGANTVVQNGDTLGRIRFCAADGTDFTNRGGEISCRVDGTPGSDDIPTRMMFFTAQDGAGSPTEAMRISSDQQISTNAYSSEAGGSCLALRQNTNSSNHNGIYQTLRSNANNTSTYHFRGLTESASNYFIYGNATAGSSSDERLKKNIETTRDGYLADIRQLRVVKFNWKTHEDGTPRELGLIAQEVEQVFPGLVQSENGQVSEDDETSYKVLKHSVLPFILLKALQEADQKIDDQAALIEAQAAQLTSQAASIASLEARLTALEGGAS